MALRWDEAKVIVVCGSPRDVAEIPEDAIVITLKPEEMDDPEAVEAIRNLLLDRTIEYRQKMIDKMFDLGATLPDPIEEAPLGESGEEARAAEQRLLEALRKREEESGTGESRGGEDDWAGMAPLAEGLTLGSDNERGVRIFISHVEELVVHN